jgi:hypothetical protein
MKEQQLKPIKQNEIKQNQITPVKKEQPKENNQNKNDIITNLPAWSIEPPLEIKRGN